MLHIVFDSYTNETFKNVQLSWWSDNYKIISTIHILFYRNKIFHVILNPIDIINANHHRVLVESFEILLAGIIQYCYRVFFFLISGNLREHWLLGVGWYSRVFSFIFLVGFRVGRAVTRVCVRVARICC